MIFYSLANNERSNIDLEENIVENNPTQGEKKHFVQAENVGQAAPH